jgi:competence protein ComFC
MFHKLLFSEREPCLLCNRQIQIHKSLRSNFSKSMICPACYGEISWITQPTCDCCGREEKVITKTQESKLCTDCSNRSHTFFEYNRSAVHYNESMRNWIYSYKYRGREQLSLFFSDLLYQAYRQYYSKIKIEALTFVPLHPMRLYERKFNQAEQLARRLSMMTSIPTIPTLTRVQDTPKQSHKNRTERLISLRGAFQGIKSLPTKGSVVIIDDIYTTGATLNECAKVLKENGWQCVYGLTVARA